MKNRYRYLWWVVAVGFAVTCASCEKKTPVEPFTPMSRSAEISPDYSNIIIPPNVAPLNFRILEAGDRFFVRISASRGRPVEVYSRDANIKIPLGQWKTLLSENKGGILSFDVFVYDSAKGWHQYQPILNEIANETIDSHLVYRCLMGQIYNTWKTMGIYQRDITCFKTKTVLRNQTIAKGCINCHTFLNNNPENMAMGFRSKRFGTGTLIARGGKVDKINTKWGYTTWHPSGKLAVYSMNKVWQFFHTVGTELRDVVDLDSAIVCYMLEKQETKIIPAISKKDRLETFPTWSPDGKYLYYCSAPIPWENRDQVPPKYYDTVRYDLMRICYDVEKDQWDEPETVLSSTETGMSILQPRISPDGRFLVFCMCQYSCFPAFQVSSDLYIMDLSTGRCNYKKLDAANSDYAESWHSWSSNGRWITFSSKRRAGFTSIYFSYIDAEGNASKAFILPQEDPEYYDSLAKVYNLPELITGPVDVSFWELAKTIRMPNRIKTTTPITGATPTTQTPGSWQRE